MTTVGKVKHLEKKCSDKDKLVKHYESLMDGYAAEIKSLKNQLKEKDERIDELKKERNRYFNYSFDAIERIKEVEAIIKGSDNFKYFK